MSAATARRTSRPTEAEDLPAVRSAEAIRIDLNQLDAERATAVAELATLEQGRDAVLLSGDDEAAEAHDLAIARQRRAIERANLRRPGIEQALADAEAREAAAALAEKQAAAEKVVQAVIDRIEVDYDQPAAKIVEFLKAWDHAQSVAVDAGIPSLNRRLRRYVIPGSRKPAVMEDFEAYVDEEGRPTANAYPYKADGMIDRHNIRPRRTFQRVKTSAEVIPDREVWMPTLSDIVNLPGASGGRGHWIGKGLAEKKG